VDALIGAFVVMSGVFAMLAYVVAAAAVFVWDITCRVMALLRDRTRAPPAEMRREECRRRRTMSTRPTWSAAH
jgi:hypothetical protein